VNDQTSFNAWQTCVSNANSCTACSDYAQAAQCLTQITRPSHQAEAICNLKASTFQSFYTSVAAFFCDN
jgi:hypothetical protein